MWSIKETRTAGEGEVEVPVNREIEHYALVWAEGENMRSYPLSHTITDAEEKFRGILREGLMIRGANGMLEWINIPKFDYAYIVHRTFDKAKDDEAL